MCKILVLCVSVLISGVLGHPLKNVFASVGFNQDSDEAPGHGAAEFVHASFQSLPDIAQGKFYTQSTTSATYQLAADEYEPPLSQVISVYDHSQNKANGFLNAEPIVDNIKEEDKYGNNGDKHAGVGRFVVNGFEGISNIINKFFEFPPRGTRIVSKGITEQLNKVGAKLVGLAK